MNKLSPGSQSPASGRRMENVYRAAGSENVTPVLGKDKGAHSKAVKYIFGNHGVTPHRACDTQQNVPPGTYFRRPTTVAATRK